MSRDMSPQCKAEMNNVYRCKHSDTMTIVCASRTAERHEYQARNVHHKANSTHSTAVKKNTPSSSHWSEVPRLTITNMLIGEMDTHTNQNCTPTVVAAAIR